MPRAPTTSDAFNAVAEPRRREILELLAAGDREVGSLVDAAGLAQPQVSKHLRVLREVGLVTARAEGQRRVYTVNADGLREVHEWVSRFERLWDHKLDRIKQRAEHAARAAQEIARNQ